MQKVISLIDFGNIKVGDTVATFRINGLANLHYWVVKGWATVIEAVDEEEIEAVDEEEIEEDQVDELAPLVALAGLAGRAVAGAGIKAGVEKVSNAISGGEEEVEEGEFFADKDKVKKRVKKTHSPSQGDGVMKSLYPEKMKKVNPKAVRKPEKDSITKFRVKEEFQVKINESTFYCQKSSFNSQDGQMWEWKVWSK